MIVQYKLRLVRAERTALPSCLAYRLYAWLLDQIPREEAACFHDQTQQALTQYLERDGVWTVNLFGDDAVEQLGCVLEHVERIILYAEELTVQDRQIRPVGEPEDFLRMGRGEVGRRALLRIVSPAAFKQSGRYVIFPQEGLLLQSLLMKWNAVCPKYPMEDADMLDEMKRGIRIVDYSLRTGRFQLKNAAIPSFYGKIILEERLPVVLKEIWNALLCLAPYSGIGIKTTLGMGGVQVNCLERQNR